MKVDFTLSTLSSTLSGFWSGIAGKRQDGQDGQDGCYFRIEDSLLYREYPHKAYESVSHHGHLSCPVLSKASKLLQFQSKIRTECQKASCPVQKGMK